MIEPEFNYLAAQRNAANVSDRADYGNLMSGFNEFAKTGGFSPEDISSFRARAAAPIRAGYSNALREVDRARSLQGGSLPGYAVLRSRMNRDFNQGSSDAMINANAAIAGLVQQGKLAGLQGGSNLYGTTPGWSSMFGNQVAGARGDALQLHDIDSRNRLGLINARLGNAAVPGKWQQGFENVSGFIKNSGEGIGAAAAPWG